MENNIAVPSGELGIKVFERSEVIYRTGDQIQQSTSLSCSFYYQVISGGVALIRRNDPETSRDVAQIVFEGDTFGAEVLLDEINTVREHDACVITKHARILKVLHRQFSHSKLQRDAMVRAQHLETLYGMKFSRNRLAYIRQLYPELHIPRYIMDLVICGRY